MKTHNSLSEAILLYLEKAGDGYIRFEDIAYNPEKYLYGYSRKLTKPAWLVALKRLREKGWIDFTADHELLMRLTDTGKEKALLVALKEEEKDWDGNWRIVSFDIPEKRRAIRNLLRRKLKEWGFVFWQQSSWISKKNCTRALRVYIRQLGIEKWVKVIESDNFDF